MPSPEIIAHRGVSRERLENTIPAFQRAIDLGADGVELDVHVTRDGTVVVHHDPVIRGASSDAALDGQPIVQLTTAEVASFRLADGGPVPTLLEVSALLRNRLTLYCELKGQGTAAPSLDILRAGGRRCAVHSFDHRMIAEAALLAPSVARGVLEVSRHVDAAGSLQSAGARDLWQLIEFIDDELVHQVHAAGGRVIAWTANEPSTIERLARLGVDGFCGDDVVMLRRVLGR
ncbi:MAG: glycerophosphodiester phosphodiesterase [Gemmatimonadaceae bacterium]